MNIQRFLDRTVKFQLRLNTNFHVQNNSPKGFNLLYRHISPGTGMGTSSTNSGSIVIGLHKI